MEAITILPAATVMLIRERLTNGIEILLLKRNKKLKFAPSHWVFAGGRVDSSDETRTDSEITKAKIAAVRELYEEAAIVVDTDALTPFYHWTTPAGQPRRFGTWFFHAEVPHDQSVTVDDGEIVDYQWISPQDAIQKHLSRQLPMLPPTVISIARIQKAEKYHDVVSEYAHSGIISVTPHMTKQDDGSIHLLYQGDSGYKVSDPHFNSSMHRLIIRSESSGRISYEFLHKGCIEKPITGNKDLFM